MPAQVELVVLVAVLAAGIAYVAVRTRRGALDEERLRRQQRVEHRDHEPEPTDPDSPGGSGSDEDGTAEGGDGEERGQ